MIRPGPTETELFAAHTDDASRARMVSRTPLRRLGRPEDIANAVAFLASADAAFITDQSLAAGGTTF